MVSAKHERAMDGRRTLQRHSHIPGTKRNSVSYPLMTQSKEVLVLVQGAKANSYNLNFANPRSRRSRTQRASASHWCNYPKGQLSAIINIYGHSGSASDTFLRNKTSRLMAAGFFIGATLGNIPVVLCVDLNMRAENNCVVAQALATNWWHDLGELYQATPPTYSADEMWDRVQPAHGATRIDHTFANCAARNIIVGFQVLGHGGRNHSGLCTYFDMGKYNAVAETAKRPKPFPVDYIDTLSELQRDIAGKQAWDRHWSDFEKAINEEDMDAAWTTFSKAGEDYYEIVLDGQDKTWTLGRSKLPITTTIPVVAPRSSSKVGEYSRTLGHIGGLAAANEQLARLMNWVELIVDWTDLNNIKDNFGGLYQAV